ncbi:hypothetical protein FA09DRAFT_331679 [Tilletiopsis washingtonensis]|uniref:N-acetyltransferase domain-containing protein n=1 Tax=Tilletiopsis washingtonensis TaxID=58919 RepID=A0A316Z3Z3_9BASI|nr:hypothetical protein FA09DRAFT_331679 [Tilletiopsis washingtonensis]PWN96096.1 hypothetical protein FA09DRAFT_331679 [Tilletiopsis washingtonensis]
MSSSAFPRSLPAPRQAFEVDTSLDRLPVDDVWDWLHTKAYWQRQRTRQQFEQQLRSAHLCFAVYDTSRAADELVGFARVVGDGVALAYLADVFILEQYRSQGLGTPFMRIILDEDGRKQVRALRPWGVLPVADKRPGSGAGCCMPTSPSRGISRCAPSWS